MDSVTDTRKLRTWSRFPGRSSNPSVGRAVVILWIAFLASAGAAAQSLGDDWEPVEGSTLDDLTLDSDGDLIFDEREATLGTNPTLADTDGDGFDDAFEDVFREFGFDPLAADNDADTDGLTDALEATFGTDDSSVDSDLDGYSDFDEVTNAFYGFDPLSVTVDADFDGLDDVLELSIGSSPGTADTDGDGFSDFLEYEVGSNPTTPDPTDSLGELAGITHSAALEQALGDIRVGGTFPDSLADDLPYPDANEVLITLPAIVPSAALIQRAVANPTVPAQDGGPNLKKLYASYDDAVKALQQIATAYPQITRLFRWTQKTLQYDKKNNMNRPNREIYAIKISDNPATNESEPELLYLSMHHARELITVPIVLNSDAAILDEKGLIVQLTSGYANDNQIKKVVDNNEIWVVPIVNPDGYQRALGEWIAVIDKVKGAAVDWRKNVRRVGNQADKKWGVDLNRNYGHEHVTTLNAVDRNNIPGTAAEPNVGKTANGLFNNGAFDIDNETYAGIGPFTEVETMAVEGLTNNQFLTGSEVDGIRCSISWHSYGGEVLHPYGHGNPPANAATLTNAQRKVLKALSGAVATAAGYQNLEDTFKTTNYPTYGDSEDWLFNNKGILALTIESYSPGEGQAGNFFPDTPQARNDVVKANVKGGLELARKCTAPCPNAPKPPGGCRTAGTSKLKMKDLAGDSQDKLLWQWKKGQATSQAEFADPLTTTAYALCIYGGTAATLIAEAHVPASDTKWSLLSTKGYTYKDSAGTDDLVQKILLKGAADDSAKVKVKGRSANLIDPPLNALPLPVIAQLVNDETQLCWEATYNAADVRDNQPGSFKAKASN